MKTLQVWLASALLLSAVPPQFSSAAEPAKDAPNKIRVLVVTGGHDFEKEQFFKLFSDNKEINYRAVEHPNAHALLKADAAKQFDVLVLYDLWQEITDEAKTNFLAMLRNGKGLVVLHHAIASYQQWPEYSRVIGGRYYLEKTTVNGIEKSRSVYKHDMHFKVHVADPRHPVTHGVPDFELQDETYGGFDVAQDVHRLLTTDEPQSGPVIGWTKTYAAARVVYLQSGHDHFAYDNPNFQRLLKQAIRWAAKQD